MQYQFVPLHSKTFLQNKTSKLRNKYDRQPIYRTPHILKNKQKCKKNLKDDI